MKNTLVDYSGIFQVMQHYFIGSRAGKSKLLGPAFHDHATIIGCFGGDLMSGSIRKLYDLIDGNGLAPDIQQPHFSDIEIQDTMP